MRKHFYRLILKRPFANLLRLAFTGVLVVMFNNCDGPRGVATEGGIAHSSSTDNGSSYGGQNIAISCTTSENGPSGAPVEVVVVPNSEIAALFSPPQPPVQGQSYPDPVQTTTLPDGSQLFTANGYSLKITPSGSTIQSAVAEITVTADGTVHTYPATCN